MILINEQLQSNKKINVLIMLNILGTLIYQGITFLLTPILTRALGTYDYGIVSIYITWSNFIYPIVGLSTSIVIPSIKMYIDDEKQGAWISSIAGLSAISYLVFTILVIALRAPLANAFGFTQTVLILLCFHCFGLTMVNYIVAYYINYQKTILQFLFTISVSVLSSVATIALLYIIHEPQYKYMAKIIGFAGSYLLVGLIAFLVLYIKGRKIVYIEAWKYALPICLPTILHQVSHILLSQSDKVMLQVLLEDSMSVVGLYGFAYTIASIGTVLWTALNNAWAPFYYGMLKIDDQENIKTKSYNYLILFTLIFAAFLLVVPEVSLIMGGSGFVESNSIIPIIHLGNYFIFLYSFAINYKIVKKMVKSIAIGTLGAGICNVILNLIFVPKYGAVAAACTSLVSYILLFLFHHITIPKSNEDYKYNLMFYGKGVVIMLVACVIYFFIYNAPVFRWAIAIAIGIYILYNVIKRRTIF